MVTDYQKIRMKIQNVLDTGKRNFIIYPFGEYGRMAKVVLNESFGIKEKYIVDNYLSKYNSNIKSLDYCRNLNNSEYTVLFTCANPDVYEEVHNELERYFLEKDIVDMFTGIGGEKKIIRNVANIAMAHYAIIGW